MALLAPYGTLRHGYKIINEDDQLRFEAWVLGMRDAWGETGMGSGGRLSWLYRNAKTYGAKRPWMTLIAFGRDDNRILGTASFAKPTEEDHSAFGVLDFVCVSLELHGHGIGRLICTETDQHIQREVNKRRGERIVNLRTINEGANRMYGRLGYKEWGEPLSLPGFGTHRSLAKTFKPVRAS